ncbi:ABC transporter permease [Carboxydochorda subterranea]|uniref:ABC transporter permease n=1 Tax=Carboxydichorda subterranea TaxID=3109565 RepID=A0ABZ1C1Y9_9FIRM|nr:ABC transporter permease [Limnochorda sp. L945t]WRP18840.1 ABC transporter permease [Limnochorda sp. L945t]
MLGAGVPLGILSGYHGGRADSVLVSAMDALSTFPALLLAITLMGMLGPGRASTVAAIFVVFVPQYFPMARGHAQLTRGEQYVEAAVAEGAPKHVILWRHVLPNGIPLLAPLVASNMAQAILVHASLSFLGLGTTPPAPNPGYEVSQAQLYMADGAWWWGVFPGLAIVVIIAGFSLLAEGLAELADPVLQRGHGGEPSAS